MNPMALIVGYVCVLAASGPALFFAMSNAGILARPFYRRYAFYLLGICGFMTLTPLIRQLGQHHNTLGQWILLGLQMAIMATMAMAVKDYHPGLLPGGETRRKWGTWFVLGTLTNAALISMIFLRVALGMGHPESGESPVVEWNHYGIIMITLGWIILYTDCKRQKVLLATPTWTTLTLTGYVFSICGLVLSVAPFLPTSMELLAGKWPTGIPIPSLVLAILGLTIGLVQFAWLTQVWASLGSLVMMIVCLCGMYHLFLAQWAFPWLGLSGTPILYLPLITALDRLTQWTKPIEKKRQRIDPSLESSLPSDPSLAGKNLILSQPLGLLTQIIGMVMVFLASTGPVSHLGKFAWITGSLWSLDTGFMASIGTYSLYLLVTWFVYTQPARGYLGLGCLFLLLLFGKPFLGTVQGTAILSGFSLMLVLVARKGSRWHESHRTLQVATDMGFMGFLVGLVLVGYRLAMAFEAETRGGFLSERLFLCPPLDALSLIAISLTATICGFRYRSILVSFCIPVALAFLFMPQLGILGLIILATKWAIDRKVTPFVESLNFPVQKFLGRVSLPLPTQVPGIAIYWALTVSLLPLTVIGFFLDSTLLLQSHGSPLTMISLIASASILIYSSFSLFNPQIYIVGLTALNLAFLIITRTIQEKAGLSVWTHPEIPLLVFSLIQLLLFGAFGRLLAWRYLGHSAQSPRPTDPQALSEWLFHQSHYGFNQFSAFLGLSWVAAISFQNLSWETSIIVSISAILIGILHAWLSFQTSGSVLIHAAFISFALGIGILLNANQIPFWETGNIIAVILMFVMIASIFTIQPEEKSRKAFGDSRWRHAAGNLSLLISFLNVLYSIFNLNGWGNPGFPPNPLLWTLGTFGLICIASTFLWRNMPLIFTGMVASILVLHGLFQRLLEANAPQLWINQSFLNPLESMGRMAHGGFSLVWIALFLACGWWILQRKIAKNDEHTGPFPIRIDQISWQEFVGLGFLKLGFLGTLIGFGCQSIELITHYETGAGGLGETGPWFGPANALVCFGYGVILLLFAIIGQTRSLVHLAGSAVVLALVFLGQNQGDYPLHIRGAIHGASILGLILAVICRYFPSSFGFQSNPGMIPAFLPLQGDIALSEPKMRNDQTSLRFCWAIVFLCGSLIVGFSWINPLGIPGILPVLYLTCCGLLVLFGSATGTGRLVLGIGGTILGYGAIHLSIWCFLPTIFDWRNQGIPDIQMAHFLLSILTGIVLGIIYFWKKGSGFVGEADSQLKNQMISYPTILSAFNLFVTFASCLVFLGIPLIVQCQQLMEKSPSQTSALDIFKTFLVPAQPNSILGYHAMILSLVLLAHTLLFSSGLALCLALIGMGLTTQYLFDLPLLGPSILGCYGLALCVLIPTREWFFDRVDSLLRHRFLSWPKEWETIRFPLESNPQSWQWRISFTGLALTVFSLFQVAFTREILTGGTSFPELLAHISRNDWIALALAFQCLSWALLSQYRWIPSWTWFLGTTLTLTLASYPLIAILFIQTGNQVTAGSLLGCGPILDGFALILLGISLFLVQKHSTESEPGKSRDRLIVNFLWIFSTLLATLGWFHSLGYVALYGSQSPTAGWLNLFCLVIPLMMLPRVVGSLGKAIPMEVRYEYLVVAILAPWFSGLLILQTYFEPGWISNWTLGYAVACGLVVFLLGKSGALPDKGKLPPMDPTSDFPQGWNWHFLGRILSLPLSAIACFLPWLALTWNLREIVSHADLKMILGVGLFPLVIESINLGIIAWIYRQKQILIGALWIANLGLVSLFAGFFGLDYQLSLMAFVVILHLGLFTLVQKPFGLHINRDNSQEENDNPLATPIFWQNGIATWAESTALVLLSIEFLTTLFQRVQPEFRITHSWIDMAVATGLMLVFGRLWARKSSNLWFHGFSLSLVHLVLTGLIFLSVVPSLPLTVALYALIWISLVAWKHPEEGWTPLVPLSNPGNPTHPGKSLETGSQACSTSKTTWARGLVGTALGLILFCAPLEWTHHGNTSLSLGILSLAWLTRWMVGRIHLGRRFSNPDSLIHKPSSENDQTLDRIPPYYPDFGWLLFLGTAISLFVELPFLSGDFLSLRIWMVNLSLPAILICYSLYKGVSRILPVPSWDNTILNRLGFGSVITAGLSFITHFLNIPVQEDPVQSLIWVVLSTAWLFFASLRYLIQWGIYLAYIGCGLICVIIIHRIYAIPIGEHSWDAAGLMAGSFFLFGISLMAAPIQKAWSCLLGNSAFRLSVLLPAGMLFVFPMAYPGPILAFLAAGSFYLFLNIQTRNRWFLYLSAVLLNMGIYWGMPILSHTTGLSQLYVIPAAVTLLIVSQLHRNEFPRSAITGIRYAAATAILAASTGEFYFSHQGNLFHFILVLFATLTLIVLGIALKIRPFLFLGTGFLLVIVLGQMGSTLLMDTQGLIRAGILIALGLTILGIMVFFNSRRSQLLANYRSFMEQPDWE